MIALQMSVMDSKYVQRVILMDKILSTAQGQTPCQTGVNCMKHAGIPLTVCDSYAALDTELQSLPQAIILGVHQSHRFRHAKELQEYSAFLQTCITAASEGRLLTPYLNFMHCPRLAMVLAAHRHGLFQQMPVTSGHMSGHMHVNDMQWDVWHSWVTHNIVLPPPPTSAAASHSLA